MSFNILLLHSHDTGRVLSPYGETLDTPNLAALAARGVVFENAHSVSPTCSPSRAALLTGQYPHQNGMMGLAHLGFALGDPTHLLSHFARSNGYTTALSGLQHVFAFDAFAKNGVSLAGFDHVHSNDEELPREKWAARFLESDAAKNGPFFLDVGFYETHRVGDDFGELAPTPADRKWARGQALAPGCRDDWANFAASARELDRKIGVVLQALENANLRENTLVIYTTDHGVAFPDCKGTLREAGTGVALLLSGPGVPQKQRVSALVSHLDLFPTLCELCGWNAPDWLEGVSLGPLLRGERETVRDAVFTQTSFHVAPEAVRAIRTPRWSLIRRFDDGARVGCNCDDSPSKTFAAQRGWLEQNQAPIELYDLENDPAQTRNLARDAEFQSVRAELEARLEAEMRRTHDPVLAGEIEPPLGAKLHPRSDYSPKNRPAPPRLEMPFGPEINPLPTPRSALKAPSLSPSSL